MVTPRTWLVFAVPRNDAGLAIHEPKEGHSHGIDNIPLLDRKDVGPRSAAMVVNDELRLSRKAAGHHHVDRSVRDDDCAEPVLAVEQHSVNVKR